MKCPKCGYIRQSRDHVFAPPTECPACGVIYSKYGIEGLLPAGAPQDITTGVKRPSPVHEDSLKQARERVERRLRKKLNPNEKDETREQTLQLARKFVSEGIRRRREEKQRLESEEQEATHAEPANDDIVELYEVFEPNENGSPAATDIDTETAVENESPAVTDIDTETAVENRSPAATDIDTETADKNLSPMETNLDTKAVNLENQPDIRDDIHTNAATDEDDSDTQKDATNCLPETTMASPDAAAPSSDTGDSDQNETAALNMDTDELDEPHEQDANRFSPPDMVDDSSPTLAEEMEAQTVQTEQASNALADTPIVTPPPETFVQVKRRSLIRLLPAVAWMILVAGIVGAVLSWTTMSDVQAGTAGAIAMGNNNLPIALLLGFAYLATGVLGFAFFWVSSMINIQLKEIRRILMLQLQQRD